MLDLSNMFLGFDSLLEFCSSCLTPVLRSFHFSGNELFDYQMQLLLSVIGVKMRKLEEEKLSIKSTGIFVEIDQYSGQASIKNQGF